LGEYISSALVGEQKSAKAIQYKSKVNLLARPEKRSRRESSEILVVTYNIPKLGKIYLE
jgi:hypothetical protein